MTKKPTIVLLAAGKSSRFFPLNTEHKSFLSIMGKPLIVRTIETLIQNKYDDIIIVISSKKSAQQNLQEILDKHNLATVVTVTTQDKAKGQGNAILSTKKYIDNDFIILMPYRFNCQNFLDSLYTTKQQTQADCVFLGTETNTPNLFGIIEYQNEKFIRVVEKPKPGTEPSNIRVLGAYLFDKEFLTELEQTDEEEYSFEKAYTNYAKKKNIAWAKIDQEIPTLKYPWHLFDFQKLLFSQLKSFRSKTSKIAATAFIDESEGPVYIGDNSIIGHTARVSGPCYIGANTLVGDFSLVRGSCIETGAKVGAHSEVARSIMMEGSTIHRAYIGDSVIGKNTKIGAGFISANRRNDRQSIQVIVKNRKIDTQRENLGTIIGGQTRIGINTGTMPGVFIGADCMIYPSQTIFQHIDHHQTLRSL